MALEHFQNNEVKKCYLSIQGLMIILERRLDPSTSYCNEVWDIVCHHEWFNFCIVLKMIVVIPIVLEFYANLKVYNRDNVLVRNSKFDIYPNAICEHYGVPWNKKDIINEIDLEFYKNVDIDAILNYLTKWMRICLGKWINREMNKCVRGSKVGIYFPHLITDLLSKKGVRMDPTEQFHHPTQSVTGDTIMMQFCELYRKQIHGWNQKRKNKMDVPSALPKTMKRLEDSSGGVTKKENKEKKGEEDDDEAMEEDDFEPNHDDFKNFFVPMHLSAASLIISGPTAQSKYSYKMRVMQGKRKRIVRLNKGP
ncbi:hypothetical protein PVK06_023847 [Gossypium arboreum]|uniref:Uncharacterized protein n=1 Tax=Gossypium arboreum TaxID=29729 RepID=A0ABR0PCE6_GOSAR|nr:hypothetical protein PVK06_023847 [Gossypium arboreum]